MSESQMWEDEFKPPTKYYIIDSFGQGVFFRTRDRAVAQALSDKIYGKNFFIVKQVMVAAVR